MLPPLVKVRAMLSRTIQAPTISGRTRLNVETILEDYMEPPELG